MIDCAGNISKKPHNFHHVLIQMLLEHAQKYNTSLFYNWAPPTSNQQEKQKKWKKKEGMWNNENCSDFGRK